MKRFSYYFGWTILLGIIFYFGVILQSSIKEYMLQHHSFWPNVLFSTIFPIVIGMLLRLPKLISMFMTKQSLTYDWIKLLGIGIPALCFIMLSILSYKFDNYESFLIQHLMASTVLLVTVSGIVLGYTLISCIKTKA